MKQELVYKWKVQFSLILMWKVFLFCGWKKKRIFPWFYQHCVSMVSVELSVDLSKSFLISRKGTFVIFSSERMSETTITIWGKTKLTVRRGRILRCLLFLCLSSFLNNLKILVAQTQYERTLSVIINGIYPLEKLWVFQITTIPPLVWSQSILTRISDNNLEINCGSPGILPNGWLEGSRTTLHAVVTFRCEEGMTFSGPSYRTICQADGRWSHPVPRCYGEYCVTLYSDPTETHSFYLRKQLDYFMVDFNIYNTPVDSIQTKISIKTF